MAGFWGCLFCFKLSYHKSKTKKNEIIIKQPHQPTERPTKESKSSWEVIMDIMFLWFSGLRILWKDYVTKSATNHCAKYWKSCEFFLVKIFHKIAICDLFYFFDIFGNGVVRVDSMEIIAHLTVITLLLLCVCVFFFPLTSLWAHWFESNYITLTYANWTMMELLLTFAGHCFNFPWLFWWWKQMKNNLIKIYRFLIFPWVDSCESIWLENMWMAVT